MTDHTAPAVATETFIDAHGRRAVRYLEDDPTTGTAAGSEVLVTPAPTVAPAAIREIDIDTIDFDQATRTDMAAEIARATVELGRIRGWSLRDAVGVAQEIAAHSWMQRERVRPADRTIERAVRAAADGALSDADRTIDDLYAAGSEIIDAADFCATEMENAVDAVLDARSHDTWDKDRALERLRRAIVLGNEYRHQLRVSGNRMGRTNVTKSPLSRWNDALSKLGFTLEDFTVSYASERAWLDATLDAQDPAVSPRVDRDLLLENLSITSYGLPIRVLPHETFWGIVADFDVDSRSREMKICTDCVMAVANGEDPVDEDDRYDWRAGYDRFYADLDVESVSLGTSMRQTDCECGPGDEERHRDECDRDTFSTWPCDLCGTPLAGEREGATVWYHNDYRARIAVQYETDEGDRAPWVVLDIDARHLGAYGSNGRGVGAACNAIDDALERIGVSLAAFRSHILVITDTSGTYDQGALIP